MPHRASSGISVSASTSDASTAADSVSDSARKNCPTTPDSRPSGANTTTVVSVELTTGAVKSAIASATGARRAFLHAPMDALHDDDRIVDDEADRHGEPAHRHQVDRLAEEPHHDKRHEHRERQRDRRDEREPPVAKEQQEDATARKPPIRMASRTFAIDARTNSARS